jgi:hypothetical protein
MKRVRVTVERLYSERERKKKKDTGNHERGIKQLKSTGKQKATEKNKKQSEAPTQVPLGVGRN